jgi:phosphoribosylglycinamide formyltransferase-1
MKRLRVAVLVSGRGSNLRALVDACTDQAYPAEIVLVIGNRRDPLGFARPVRAGIPCKFVSHADRTTFAAETDKLLNEYGIELVALAGFMRILDTTFVNKWHDRMVNIHPSLLPAFPGLHAQRQALAAGVRFSGCTVHFVRPEVDSGPIIAQGLVPVHPDDDEATLAARILQREHELYPHAIRLYAEGRLQVIDERVKVDGWIVPAVSALNPDVLVPSMSPAIPARRVG